MENKVIQLDLVVVSHIIADQEPQKVVSQVEEFKKGKQKFREIYSTTTVATNAANNQINFMVVTSCLMLWETTVEDYKAFQNRLQLMNGKLV